MGHESWNTKVQGHHREREASSAWWRKLRSVYLVLLLMKFYSLIHFRKIFTIFEYFSCLKVLFLACHKNLVKKKKLKKICQKKKKKELVTHTKNFIKLQHCLSFHAFFFLSHFILFCFSKKKKKKILVSFILLWIIKWEGILTCKFRD